MSEKEEGFETPEQAAAANQRAGDAVRALSKYEGFAVLQSAIQTARDHWTAIALQPAQSEAAAIRTEFAKGAVFGLTLALGLPASIMALGKEADDEEAKKQETE